MQRLNGIEAGINSRAVCDVSQGAYTYAGRLSHSGPVLALNAAYRDTKRRNLWGNLSVHAPIIIPFAGYVNTAYGMPFAQELLMSKPLEKPVVLVLAANLEKLMKSNSTLSTCKKLSNKSGVGNGTVDRVRRGKAVCNIETLQALSNAFGRQAWQLLVENFDPKAPPVLRGNTEQEKKFYDFLESLTKK